MKDTEKEQLRELIFEKEQLRKELIHYLDKLSKPVGQRRIESVINAVFDGTVKELFYDEEE